MNCYKSPRLDSHRDKSFQMFYEALKGIQKYDPVPIGSIMDGKLQNGVFEGLSSLRNDSNINVDCDDELVVLSTVLDVSGASINYQWKQKLLLTFSGSVWAKVKNIQFALELTLNMTHGIKLDVTNLKLTKMEGLKFGFSGLGPLNPLIKVLGTVVLNVLEQKITQKIEELLRDTLESELSKFKISF
ncbi:hypothetical protein AVEN_270428-1 [Araneus ventricosus]|uniref:Uncharacterized protein n=1 Tax=Araneus ventricosus TaxID=182803 RepID=A0A4Y2NIA8_ARAVE|nr:hypothetical protein AVEN_246428-1 [Araneus ventricosus]GBN38556.1 hypothetical protein AVEN_270428-1 [Araneus ventricosus]